jgi:hypothetical protein
MREQPQTKYKTYPSVPTKRPMEKKNSQGTKNEEK